MMILLLFSKKFAKEKDKRKRNVKISRKKTVICNHFNTGFCKFRKRCKFLHICRHFISGICMSDKRIFDHVELCSVLSCIDKSRNFAHASSGVKGRFKSQPF